MEKKRSLLRKSLSWILCLAMVLAMVPAVFATEAETENFEFVGANMSLDNSLAMNFAFSADHYSDWTGFYAEIVKEYADGREDVTVTIPSQEWVRSGSYYLVSYNGVALEDGQDILPLDIHIDGVSKENTTPIQVYLGQILPSAMNIGNVTLYHVENGEAVPMTQVMTLAELDAHNEFYYDPITGDITVSVATFSEFTLLSEAAAWEGKANHTWYDADATELTIANADQLWSFSQIVGGMAEGIEQDDFHGKTVKLIADIDLNDLIDENGKVFYPIGYYNNLKSYAKESGVSVTSNVSSFEGIFDGNGHTVKNFYQNTWEMFGNYNSGYSGTPNHYKDAMGLFGYVYGGKIYNNESKNTNASCGGIKLNGIFNMEGGEISGNLSGTTASSHEVLVYHLGTAIINGGTITHQGTKEGNTVNAYRGHAVINDGYLDGDVSCGFPYYDDLDKDGVKELVSEPSLTINDGTITGNVISNSSSNTDAPGEAGYLTITGGTFAGRVIRPANVLLEMYARLVIEGGIFTNSAAADRLSGYVWNADTQKIELCQEDHVFTQNEEKCACGYPNAEYVDPDTETTDPTGPSEGGEGGSEAEPSTPSEGGEGESESTTPSDSEVTE